MDDYRKAMEYGMLQYADVFTLLTENGFQASFTQTGGMCAAIEIYVDDERFALITENDGPLEWERAEHHGWAVGVYERADTSDAVILETVSDSSSDSLLNLLASVRTSLKSEQ
ncbi:MULTISPECIES: hypothetical protein [Rhodococcus]|uniref:hypothetical protein n=1 Tax=Rhodococcus TaxID=1827 RepID=UPI001E4CB826|nr:hypothetical protein [Rhodococcus pyridinivorans]MCD2118325.1 hypothetical protein [Rhodococcus pyridinivorans]MCZ4627248.1 hypothetical protein [Rhodococcus pyridinivorans]MCZ4648440.1 hypothetical protein [Rhodococcus pyridinivorans]MDJ0481125.1 hypothetical protein [Rhodococcus pyridinivorans]MDV7254591.1 hypothetical protein [Rhodococcus pyridinivorans]